MSVAATREETIQRLICHLRKNKDDNIPFVFFTGAGCSLSAGIPLAGTLLKEIESTSGLRELTSGLSPEDRKDYGKCMARLSKSQRRKLLTRHIDAAKVNWAHIALACLMEAGYVSRVVTFNFDNILAKACGLLGIYPATYDFTSSSPNLHKMIVDPSIVHLHGQGYGFSLLNSDDETNPQAKTLNKFIDDTLQEADALFIGYSGLADAFFKELKKAYNQHNHLYWAAYEQSLKHENLKHINKFFRKNSNLTHFIGEADADQFLIQLAQGLECFPPEVVDNPAQHVLSLLDKLTDFPVSNYNNPIDILNSCRWHLYEYRAKIDEGNDDNLRGLLLRGKINISYILNTYASRASVELLGDDDKKIVAVAYNAMALKLIENKDMFLNFDEYEKSISLFKFYVDMDSESATAYNNYGVTLMRMAIVKQDIDLFRLSSEQLHKAIDLHKNYRSALENYGYCLMNIGLLTKEQSVIEKSLSYYESAILLDSYNPNTQDNYGLAILSLAKLTNDVDLYDRAKSRFEYAERFDDQKVYNFACYYSLTNQPELCKEKILRCEQADTLPKPYAKKHLTEDTDLDNVRELGWFQELLARLPD